MKISQTPTRWILQLTSTALPVHAFVSEKLIKAGFWVDAHERACACVCVCSKARHSLINAVAGKVTRPNCVTNCHFLFPEETNGKLILKNRKKREVKEKLMVNLNLNR